METEPGTIEHVRAVGRAVQCEAAAMAADWTSREAAAWEAPSACRDWSVRDVAAQREVQLASYRALQNPQVIEDRVLAQVINGISTRKYERAAVAVPECFGMKRNSI